MAKEKFRFNRDSLKYDRIELSTKDKILRFLAYFMGSILLAFLYLLVFSHYFDLPKERSQKREINQLVTRIQIMDGKVKQMKAWQISNKGMIICTGLFLKPSPFHPLFVHRVWVV